MKKILALVAVLMMAASSSFADSSKSGSSNGNWVIQVQGGIVAPVSSEAASYISLGWTGEAQVGYAFSKDFSLSVESGIDSMGFNTDQIQKQAGISGATFTSAPSLTHIPIELVGQYNFTGGSVTPYVLLGVGVAIDSIGGTTAGSYNGASFSQTSASVSNTNLELDPGFGVAFALSDQINLFVQGKVEMDFAPTTGANAESSNDNPILLIPVQAGLTFNLM